MRGRKAKQGEKIYLIRAILSDWYGRVRGRSFRILAIPEEFTLYSLAESILDAFEFDFDHCFGFYDNVKRWMDSRECYELFKDMEEEGEDWIEPCECESVKKTKINAVFNTVGKKMLFLFDYGDEWHFIVELRGTKAPDRGSKYPIIVKSVGEAPPQYDVGNAEDEF